MEKESQGWFVRPLHDAVDPRLLDNKLASALILKGDLVPDFRLIDYFVSNLSKETGPGLNGTKGNHDRLKEELMEMPEPIYFLFFLAVGYLILFQ